MITKEQITNLASEALENTDRFVVGKSFNCSFNVKPRQKHKSVCSTRIQSAAGDGTLKIKILIAGTKKSFIQAGQRCKKE